MPDSWPEANRRGPFFSIPQPLKGDLDACRAFFVSFAVPRAIDAALGRADGALGTALKRRRG
jgi:hypothetical protein